MDQQWNANKSQSLALINNPYINDVPLKKNILFRKVCWLLARWHFINKLVLN